VDHGAELVCVVSSDVSVASEPARLWVVPRLPPIEPAAPVTKGLNYAIYEGHSTSLPDFDSLEPLRSDDAGGVGIPPRVPPDGFALSFDGLLNVREPGAYTFFVNASGACRVYVAGREAAFVSPFANSREASGTVGLDRGKHAFRVLFAQTEGTPRLQVELAGPKLTRRALPPSWLERINPRVLNPPQIAPRGERFSGPVWVRLASTTEETVIQYTLDGSDPDGASPQYERPFLLKASGMVKARAFRLGGDGVTHASAVSQKAFVIEGDRPFGLSGRTPPAMLNTTARPEDLPPRLSQTGIFASLDELAPNPGFIPYDVNSPLWSDGAQKRRWIALPGDAPAVFREKGAWAFPPGTVFVKHFEYAQADASPRRLETRVLFVAQDGGGYGATYRWNQDQTDADLLVDAATETLVLQSADGPKNIAWTYPSRKDCLVCHTQNAGFVLGVNTRQLNRDLQYLETDAVDNQLRAWRNAGLLENAPAELALASLPKLAPIDDDSSPLEHRVRSYLDANCAQCHRPGGARGTFDARFDVPSFQQGLIGGKLVAADLGIPNAAVVTPGSLDRSMLYLRMNRRSDVFNMPPLASNHVDQEALAVIAQWIRSRPAP
jgi:uncharacterized repeat protein (TIGR03806 family)